MRYALWLMIGLGSFLRFVGITLPDMSTDEAQFALGDSAAQPPLGLTLFEISQSIFGPEILSVRALSAVAGILTILILYRLTRSLTDKNTALIVAGVTALFPSHIFFSRLAYLSVFLALAWAYTLYRFLEARKDQSSRSLFYLFVAVVAACFVKTQGILVPAILLLGIAIERKGRVLKNPIAWTLVLGMLPTILYIGTNLGILATLTQNTGSMYGVHDPVERLRALFDVVHGMMPAVLILSLVSLSTVQKKHWPLWCVILIGSTIGFLLGPSHAYYSTHLVFWALPIGFLIARYQPLIQYTLLGIIAVSTLLVTWPTSPVAYPLFQEEGYWNVHAEKINEFIVHEDVVVVHGNAGHHLRWYIDTRVLVGKDLENYEQHMMHIVLKESSDIEIDGDVLYEDEKVRVVQRSLFQ